jgi:anti-sigma regulatory factor (Ser/Thr protein kinase)
MTVLDEAGSVPLAVQRDHRRPQESTALPPGSTVMLFTDGLVERRGESIDDGIARVADVLTRHTNSPVDTIADVVLRELAPADGYDDDVAIVVCRPPVASFRIDEDATADRLADVRHRLDAWLQSVPVATEVAADVVLAVGEACTNSVEHAYRGRPPGTMRVEAAVDGDEVHLRVIDFGSWKPPVASRRARGRGLLLIRAVSDESQVNSGTAGTTVAMSFRFPADTRLPA